jgi:hypothetical protein
MFRKIFFYFLTAIFFSFFYLTLDFIISNTLLKSDYCYEYKTSEKGYFYYLKKNCQGKGRFKRGFPIANLFSDEMGLRTGKKVKKNPNNKNILTFGDSMTFGAGLEYEDTYVGLIDKKMTNYNIYNFAVGSYSPSVHLYKLKTAIKNNIVPHKILLFLDLSDVLDESQRWIDDEQDGIPKRPGITPNWGKKGEPKRGFIDRNFKLSKELSALVRFNLRFLRSEIKNMSKTNNKNLKIKTSIQGQYTYTKIENLDKRFWKKNYFSKGLKKIKEKIDEISLLAKRHNSEFYLIIYPWAETLELGQKQFSWSDFGKGLCKNGNCILINAIPEFKNYKENNKNWVNKLYFLNDEHLNRGGAKLLSEIVIKELNK